MGAGANILWAVLGTGLNRFILFGSVVCKRERKKKDKRIKKKSFLESPSMRDLAMNIAFLKEYASNFFVPPVTFLADMGLGMLRGEA